MPRLIPNRLAAACALALLLMLSSTAVAAAKKVSAELRVVGKNGRVLAEEERLTTTTRVPTSRRATCFGRGSRGSGRATRVRGATALGLLAGAARANPALRPFYVTDAFSFGLGLCTIGGESATSKLSWYLKVDHRGSQVGGEKARLKPGDEVLWALASYPYPNELSLVGPETATAGLPFKVRVFSYDERGKRRPVKGAAVTGADGPTGADGSTLVTLVANEDLRATHGGEIPSNGLPVCVEICP
jgi:hypothetical protein